MTHNLFFGGVNFMIRYLVVLNFRTHCTCITQEEETEGMEFQNKRRCMMYIKEFIFYFKKELIYKTDENNIQWWIQVIRHTDVSKNYSYSHRTAVPGQWKLRLKIVGLLKYSNLSAFFTPALWHSFYLLFFEILPFSKFDELRKKSENK